MIFNLYRIKKGGRHSQMSPTFFYAYFKIDIADYLTSVFLPFTMTIPLKLSFTR